MIPTHEWNTVRRAGVLALPMAALEDGTGHVLRVAVSVASEDGVYDLAELRADLPYVCLPDRLTDVLTRLLDRLPGTDLRELRHELSALELDTQWLGEYRVQDPDEAGGHAPAPTRAGA